LAAVAAVIAGGVSIFRARETLRQHPGLWEAMLAQDVPLAARREGVVRRWQRFALLGGLAVAVGAVGYAWATSPDRPAEHESLAREMETAGKFLETWNSGDARVIASCFRPEVQDEIARGLPGFVREANVGDPWPKVGSGLSDRKDASMTIDYPIVSSGHASYLQTDWEWRDGRWTLMRIDFGRSFR